MHTDQPFNRTHCVSLPLAGVGAGALGIAAGTLLSPLLLSAGMNPLVCVASTGMMVLFTSSSTAAQYLILGRLQVSPPCPSPSLPIYPQIAAAPAPLTYSMATHRATMQYS